MSGQRRERKPIVRHDSLHCRTCIRVLGRRLVPTVNYARPVTLTCTTTQTHRILNTLPRDIRLRIDNDVVGGIGDIVIPGANRLGNVRTTITTNVVTNSTSERLRIVSRIDRSGGTTVQSCLRAIPVSVRRVRRKRIFSVVIARHDKSSCTGIHVTSFRAGVYLVRGGNQILCRGPLLGRRTRQSDQTSHDLLGVGSV